MINYSLEKELSPGTVLTKWYKQEGDIVKEGDILCQIETPNMVLDLDSSKSGFVAEIRTFYPFNLGFV